MTDMKALCVLSALPAIDNSRLEPKFTDADLPKKQRDNTILLAAGRAMRSAGNAAAQASLIDRSQIGAEGIKL
ncbi:hypothetical protein IP81_17045, partial [Novosphingobium sp. AAP83]|uniref:hypothetical protein n=1 Tax=Novosphingobium sp. AAP83 TaxID=1523425 RepID=UPI0006CC74BC